jgi:hypothetical protein
MPYKGRATRTGNSRAIRLESALFTSHPEFAEGDMEADVIAPGYLLVRTRSQDADASRDPVFGAFLAFLENQITERPDLLRPLGTEDVAGLDELLDGVVYDKEEALDDEFELP